MNLIPTKYDVEKLSVPERQRLLLDLEATCKKQVQVDIPVKHYFANGVYAREMYVPKGVGLVGKIHRFENINVISKGKVMVFTDQGVSTLTAPCTFVGKAGVKRAIVALRDTIWTTFHTSVNDDVDQIEQHHIAPSYTELIKG
jgi:hypothetical protein